MAAFLLDADGTFFVHGTNELALGAAEVVRRAHADGHQLYLVTQRWSSNPELGAAPLDYELRLQGVKIDGILWDVRSPRVLVNDAGCVAVAHVRNGPLEYDRLKHALDAC